MGASAALLATLTVLAALLCSCRLWGESLVVRAYHHQVVRTRYDPRKAPVIETTRALEPGELAAAKRLAALCCALSPNALSRKYGAFDSDSSGGALYWHQMAPLLTPALWADLRAVQGAAGTAASAARRRPMQWNVLRYSGTEGSFSWHYDSEDPADCRVLFCTEATAGAGFVEFVDSAGQVRSLAKARGTSFKARRPSTASLPIGGQPMPARCSGSTSPRPPARSRKTSAISPP